jgi:hypothetical protein
MRTARSFGPVVPAQATAPRPLSFLHLTPFVIHVRHALFVIPAQAGIQGFPRRTKDWFPAFTGMTGGGTGAGFARG